MAPRGTPLPPKRDVALKLLEGPSLFVHLDPRRPGVIVPKWLANQPQLVLQLGLNLAVRIPDLVVDDDGICCTLSFNRSPFWCRLPWAAVYALVGEDGHGMVWPDDIPSEIRSGISGAAQDGAKPKATRAKSPRRKAPDGDAAPEDKRPSAPKPRAVGKAAARRPTLVEEPLPDNVVPLRRPPKPEPVAEPPAPPVAAAPPKKPKRELPSYLRVIK